MFNYLKMSNYFFILKNNLLMQFCQKHTSVEFIRAYQNIKYEFKQRGKRNKKEKEKEGKEEKEKDQIKE